MTSAQTRGQRAVPLDERTSGFGRLQQLACAVLRRQPRTKVRGGTRLQRNRLRHRRRPQHDGSRCGAAAAGAVAAARTAIAVGVFALLIGLWRIRLHGAAEIGGPLVGAKTLSLWRQATALAHDGQRRGNQPQNDHRCEQAASDGMEEREHGPIIRRCTVPVPVPSDQVSDPEAPFNRS